MKWTHHPPDLWTCGMWKIEDFGPEHDDIGRFFLTPDSSRPTSNHPTLEAAMQAAEKMEKAA